MIIYVKVNPALHPIGTTWKGMAWRAWQLGRLLGDPIFRNQKKILVVISNHAIVATFCIHGVASDAHAIPMGRIRVRFALLDTLPACHANFITIYSEPILNHINRVPRSCGYININLIIAPIHQCDCVLNIIPVYNTLEIYNGNLVNIL